jgi:hypothetical protein
MNETPGSGGVGERPTNGASTSATRMLTWACLFIVGLFYT